MESVDKHRFSSELVENAIEVTCIRKKSFRIETNILSNCHQPANGECAHHYLYMICQHLNAKGIIKNVLY